jgi:hypothetical protein
MFRRYRKKDDPDNESQADDIAHGTSSLISGGLPSFDDLESFALTAVIQQRQRNEWKRSGNSTLSPNAKQLLDPEFAHEIEIDDYDEVSSMNDSVYFGGGASVTGFRRAPIIKRADPSSPALGASAEKPIDLLSNHDDMEEEEDPLKIEEDLLKNFSMLDLDYVAAQKQVHHQQVTAHDGLIDEAVSDHSNDDDEQPKKIENMVPFPAWMQRAPRWIKLSLIASLCVIIFAIVLAISVTRNSGGESKAESSQKEEPAHKVPDVFSLYTRAPTHAPTERVPTASPTAGKTVPPTKIPTIAPTPPPVNSPTQGPTNPATLAPVVITLTPTTSAPTRAPTLAHTQAPVMPTYAPTMSSAVDTQNIIQFYLTAGHYDDDMMNYVDQYFPHFPTRQGYAFMVHMGDWNDPSSTSCSEASFVSVSQLFQKSSIPVYFVMGDDDSVNCPDHSSARTYWKSYLVDFEATYFSSRPWEVFRQGELSSKYSDFNENFMFSHSQVAFVSIDIVGGSNENRKDIEDRQKAALSWVETAYEYYRNTVDTIFVFAHSGPSEYSNQNDPNNFYSSLFDHISKSDLSYVLVYHSSSSWGFSERYNNIENLDVVEVEGPIWPPLRMTIDYNGGDRTISLDTDVAWKTMDVEGETGENVGDAKQQQPGEPQQQGGGPGGMQ